MKKGFTLAEVLITLGIIGVVAAITTPILIQNYQKHVWVNQLKKSVNTLENGFKLAMAEEEVDDIRELSFMPKNPVHCKNNMSNENCKIFMDKFKKYLNFEITQSTVQKYIYWLDGSGPFPFPMEINLLDGTQIAISLRYYNAWSMS